MKKSDSATIGRRPQLGNHLDQDARNADFVGSLEHGEQYRHNFLRCDLAVQVSLNHDKLLSAGQADRDHHPSASLELVDQGRRDQVRRGRNNLFVEGGVIGPAGIAVADAEFDVGVALLFQARRALRPDSRGRCRFRGSRRQA
jgi:hypothetical protein